MTKKKSKFKNRKNIKNVKNIHWKLTLIDNTIKENKEPNLCKEKKTYNGTPIEIPVNFNDILMDIKIKENYTIWKKKNKIQNRKI